MKIITGLTFLSVFIFFSCAPAHKENNDVPENVLTSTELVDILTDAYLAEGASGINIKQVTGQQVDSVYLFNPLKDHNCTKSKFDTSITYYSNHPKAFKQIYEQVLEKLSQIQAKGKL